MKNKKGLPSGFVEACNAFCGWVESKSNSGARQDAVLAIKIISQLFLEALKLERPEIGREENTDDKVSIDTQFLENRFQDFPVKTYTHCYDPLEETAKNDPVSGDMLDDFRDIYVDLKTFLAAYRLTDQANAIWEVHFGFYTHWGRHVVSAMDALHSFISKSLITETANQGKGS
jgi:hypothetical protein